MSGCCDSAEGAICLVESEDGQSLREEVAASAQLIKNAAPLKCIDRNKQRIDRVKWSRRGSILWASGMWRSECVVIC